MTLFLSVMLFSSSLDDVFPFIKANLLNDLSLFSEIVIRDS